MQEIPHWVSYVVSRFHMDGMKMQVWQLHWYYQLAKAQYEAEQEAYEKRRARH